MEEKTHDMNYKEKLKYWKEHDPIRYSEMTSDPTNADSDYSGCLGLFLVLGLVGLLFFFTTLVTS